MNRSNLMKRLSVCVLAGAVIATALPPATAYMQGDSPLPTPQPPAPAPNPTAAPKPAPARRTVPPKITPQVITETGANPFYVIDVKYPALPAGGNNDAFNQLAKQTIDEVIASFKADIAANGDFTDTVAYTSSLYIDYEVVRNSKGIISIRFNNSIYYAGAAHPNPFTRVLNFDLNTGQSISLEEVFKPGVDYLTTLSNYCKRVLQRRGTLMFPEGADPLPENHQNWNMGRNNLIIRFDAYQVAPYAAGPQDCQVPLLVLRRQLADPRRW